MSKKPIVRTTTRVPATYEDVHEDWTAEKILECFGDDPSCIVVPLLNKVEALERERDALADALRELAKWTEQSTDTRICPVSLLRALNKSRALLAEQLEGKG